ncbi:MAG: right-handed parallel beta-helix repeat-containing protein, partial [Planctomycetota bacterium]|nr:right-handed parallel beta-helix repeat-containing protein [Planctomycetota bacterium]
GTPDCLDGCPSDPETPTPGVCGFGVPETDPDLDVDPDCLDGCPEDPAKTEPGDCGCGVPEVDTDLDGTSDCIDGCPGDPETTDPGACGCGVAETDGDLDGTPDCVDPCPTWNGSCDEDGTLELGPTESIQAAIDALPDGGSIRLLAGTFTPPTTIRTDGRAIELRGTTDADGRPLTILDGVGSRRLLLVTEGPVGPSTFEDLVLRDGRDDQGGAVLVQDAAPGFVRCRFEGSSAFLGGAMAILGGAPLLVDCEFSDNDAPDGGGAIYAEGAEPYLAECRLTGNTATTGIGGAILGFGGSRCTLDRCEVRGNLAGTSGGGLYLTGSSLAIVVESVLCDNLPDQVIGPLELDAASCVEAACDYADGFTDSGQALGNSISRSVALGDLDGDGDLDAWVANYLNEPNTAWINDGTGTFTNSGQALGTAAGYSVALGDLDGDGDLDAWVANRGESNTVWTNDGNGTFTNTGQELGNTSSFSVAL